MIPPVQHDILRLQVAVDDPVLVEVVQRQQHLSNYIKHNMAILLSLISVVDPDPYSNPIESGLNGVPGSGSKGEKITNKNRKKIGNKFYFLKCWMFPFKG